MVGFFKSAVVDDPVLGRLQRSRGLWRGAVDLGGGKPTPLALIGSNREPDAAALAAAREIVPAFKAWRPAIAQALFDHYAPYAEADAEETGGSGLPQIGKPDQVWAHASLHSIAVSRIGGELTTELAYAVAWDEDHLLGARFQANRLVELCGSILPQ